MAKNQNQVQPDDFTVNGGSGDASGGAPTGGKKAKSAAYVQPDKIETGEFNYDAFKDVKVIRVKHPDDEDTFFIINAHDFDEANHTPFSEEDEKRAAVAVKAQKAAEVEASRLDALKTIVRGV